MHFLRVLDPVIHAPVLALMLGIVLSAFSADLSKKPDDWFKSEEGINATACILSWQSAVGS